MRNLAVFFGKILFMFINRKKNISNPKKILIIRSGGLGDVILSTPLIMSIKIAYPQAKIDYLVGKYSAAALFGNKNLSRIIEVEDKIIFGMDLFATINLSNQIKKEKYDCAFILDKSYLWGLFTYLAGIPLRIGFDRQGEGFALHRLVKFEGKKYEAEYYLDLAREVRIKPQKLILNVQGISISKSKKGNAIGMAIGGATNPGHTFYAKRWPFANYVSLANKLAKKGLKIHLFGGETDKEILRLAQMQIKGSKIIKGELKEIAREISKCKVFITHDSGLLHVAATTDVNIIAIFAPTNPIRFAPKNAKVFSVNSDCCPCYDLYGNFRKDCEKCTAKISVDEIFKEVKKYV